MALITTPAGGDAAAQAVLEEAEEHYRRTIRALHTIIEEVEAGQTARARELKGALSDLGKAAQTAFDERVRVEKRLRTETGIVHEYALDLDAARVEIGRRLDRLRDAQRAGCLSGEPE
ncbi:MAG: hypothetical protein JXJ18_05425 [Rhodobacteraceae bacterium]|nr:hypothetical protein [Paracoccaceae bacterium]